MCFVTQISCLSLSIGGLRGQLTDDIGTTALRQGSYTVTHTIVPQEKFNNLQYHMTNFLNKRKHR